MGRHSYPCQSNTQVSYMTSEVVTPSTHPTGVLPASWQPHVWTCLILTPEDLVESLLLLSCFFLSCHRSNWCLRSGRAKANAIHLHSLGYIFTLLNIWISSLTLLGKSVPLSSENDMHILMRKCFVFNDFCGKRKQALSAMRHFRSHLNKRGFSLYPTFYFLERMAVDSILMTPELKMLLFTHLYIISNLYVVIFCYIFLTTIIQLPHLSSYNKHWKGKFTQTWMLKDVSASV